ncbi:putative membrane protein [Sanguibacter gelidistatuariae]|uniref:Putative membrane protein n=1 Tax=Sanguibacter gelidistatuariae TaxID=1814289 RepID=A0A1G6HJ35_9MICO|nr:YhgE/Pip domain-containing protein [Sanguibacter gelidistatuariae]SDB94262.1 putative membrane protein [Sanguibacter gelidistatuariae]
MSFTSTGTELRRFRRGLLPKLGIGAMILVPLLYGALYLWAFWDPMGNLDLLPVAIVNSDSGTVMDDEAVNVGDQVTTSLVDSGDLKWARVDAEEADRGVRDGTYYFAVTIPADFSSTVASAAGDDPSAAQIMVTYNDANSFLATTLGGSAMTQVQGAIREQIGEQAVDKLLVGLGSARDGFAQATDGSLTLTAASGQLSDGAAAVADGATSAADGAALLATGTGALADGASSAETGAGQLADGAGTLASASSTLNTGAQSLAGGTTNLAAGAGALSTGASTVSTGADALATGASGALTGATTLASGATSTQAGLVQLASGAQTLAGGFTAETGLVAGMNQAVTGAQTLSAGIAAAQTEVNGLAGQVPTLRQLVQANIVALQALPTTPETTALITTNRTVLTALPTNEKLAASAVGFQTLVDGANQLATSTTDGLPALATGLTKASAGASALNAQLQPGTSAPTVRDGVDQVAAGATSLRDGLTTLSSGATSLADGTTALTTGASQLATGATTLDTGARTLAGGSAQLSAGASTLSTGASSLLTGTQQLAAGTAAADTGAQDLATGTATLADGAGQVSDGSVELTAGTQTLADALGSGADALPDDGQALREQRAQVIAAPVTVTNTHIAQAEGFGEGFAPFFIPLALFVGALITWLLLRPIPSRALATPASGWRTTLAGYLPALVIGVAQVAVMLAVIHFGVGLQMTHVAGTIAFTMLVAAAFLAVQQALIALLGPAAGKVAILALLMLQLASSGGTYPVETTATFFQVIHPLLPMSYAVDGLRQVITGGVDGRLGVAIAYLLGVLLLSLAVSAWRAGRMRTWTLERLHPALEI